MPVEAASTRSIVLRSSELAEIEGDAAAEEAAGHVIVHGDDDDGGGDGGGVGGDGDGDGGGGGGADGATGGGGGASLCETIALAAADVIARQEAALRGTGEEDDSAVVLPDARPSQHRIAHPKSLELGFATQNVPIAMRLFSLPMAEAMHALGRARAAEAVTKLACWFDSFDQRGFIGAVRAEAAANFDEFLIALHPSLEPRQPYRPVCAPTSSYVGGFSRVAVESVLMQNSMRRCLEAMLGADGAKLVFDRREGSDLCETANSMSVAKLGESAPVTRWLQYLPRLARYAQQLLTPMEQLGFPVYTGTSGVYQHRAFEAEWRGCPCKPPCRPGAINPNCPCCSSRNRHTISIDRLLDRGNPYAARSTRQQHHVGRPAAAAPHDAPLLLGCSVQPATSTPTAAADTPPQQQQLGMRLAARPSWLGAAALALTTPATAAVGTPATAAAAAGTPATAAAAGTPATVPAAATAALELAAGEAGAEPSAAETAAE